MIHGEFQITGFMMENTASSPKPCLVISQTAKGPFITWAFVKYLP